MKRLEFLGDSLWQIRQFPFSARKEAGVQLFKVQIGLDPSDWKPMKAIGAGVREIRIRDEAGAFRVFYVANVGDAIFVLHAFQNLSCMRFRRRQNKPQSGIWISPLRGCGKSEGARHGTTGV